MSLGNLFSAIGYGIMGFLYGGPVGAAVGFVIGFGISLAMDALAPDMPSPGQPNLSELSLPTADEGINIPDILGTTKLSGNIFQYFGNNTVAITEEVETGGKGGSDSETVTTGYKYYLSWAMGICLGPVDTLFSVYAGDHLVYEGDLPRPDSGVSVVTLAPLDVEYDSRSGSSIGWSPPLDQALLSEGWVEGGYQYVISGVYPSYEESFFGLLRSLIRLSFNSYLGIGFMHYTDPTDGVVYNSTGRNLLSWYEDPVSGRETWVLASPFDGFMGWPPANPVDRKNYRFSMLVAYEEDYAIPSTGIAMGSMYFYYGTDNQAVNSKMKLNIPNTPPYRGLCYAFFNNVYIGQYNRMPSIKFVVGKFPEFSFNNQHRIGDFDYNPAHAIWHIKSNSRMANLPEEYLDSISFNAAANTLATEGRGVSILFDRQQTAMAYISTTLEHANAILRYSSSGDLKDEPK